MDRNVDMPTLAPPQAEALSRKKNVQPRRRVTTGFIEDKKKRSVAFSKRKQGLLRKAHELASMTGCSMLLTIKSETNNCYSFATEDFTEVIHTKSGRDYLRSHIRPDGEKTVFLNTVVRERDPGKPHTVQHFALDTGYAEPPSIPPSPSPSARSVTPVMSGVPATGTHDLSDRGVPCPAYPIPSEPSSVSGHSPNQVVGTQPGVGMVRQPTIEDYPLDDMRRDTMFSMAIPTWNEPGLDVPSSFGDDVMSLGASSIGSSIGSASMPCLSRGVMM